MTTQEILEGLKEIEFWLKPQYKKPVTSAIGYIILADKERKTKEGLNDR